MASVLLPAVVCTILLQLACFGNAFDNIEVITCTIDNNMTHPCPDSAADCGGFRVLLLEGEVQWTGDTGSTALSEEATEAAREACFRRSSCRPWSAILGGLSRPLPVTWIELNYTCTGTSSTTSSTTATVTSPTSTGTGSTMPSSTATLTSPTSTGTSSTTPWTTATVTSPTSTGNGSTTPSSTATVTSPTSTGTGSTVPSSTVTITSRTFTGTSSITPSSTATVTSPTTTGTSSTTPSSTATETSPTTTGISSTTPWTTTPVTSPKSTGKEGDGLKYPKRPSSSHSSQARCPSAAVLAAVSIILATAL